MNRRPSILLYVLTLLCLLGLIAPAAFAAPSSPPIQKASDFQMGRYAGKVVVMEIGTIGCSNSERGISEMEKLSKSGKKDTAQVFVNANANEADLKGFLAKSPVSYDVYYDPDKKIAATLNYQIIPTVYIIDKWGAVRFKGSWDDKKINAMLTTLASRGQTRPPDSERSKFVDERKPGSFFRSGGQNGESPLVLRIL